MKLKAIIFDMDGIIIDSEPLWGQSMVKTLASIGIETSEQELRKMSGLPALKVSELFLIKHPEIQISEKELADMINYDGANYVIKKKPLFPNIPSVLEYLVDLNIQIGIASASPRYMLESIVEECGIKQYFSTISSATELEYNKPHPAVYLKALKDLDVSTSEAMGIEDSVVGMTAVKAASMKCTVVPDILAYNDLRWNLADFKIKNIIELKQLVY